MINLFLRKRNHNLTVILKIVDKAHFHPGVQWTTQNIWDVMAASKGMKNADLVAWLCSSSNGVPIPGMEVGKAAIGELCDPQGIGGHVSINEIMNSIAMSANVSLFL